VAATQIAINLEKSVTENGYLLFFEATLEPFSKTNFFYQYVKWADCEKSQCVEISSYSDITKSSEKDSITIENDLIRVTLRPNDFISMIEDK